MTARSLITNPRTQRRVQRRTRRRVRRAGVAAVVLTLGAATLLVLPAAASPERHYSADADRSLASIQAFWAGALPTIYGRPYRAIPADRVHPYSSEHPPPGCGSRRTIPYPEVAGNAFYCPEGDFIAYDVERLVPTLRKRYGDVAVGLVLAHEMGHAVQARVGAPEGAFVTIELQADCFAGAWARYVGARDDFTLSEDDVDRALSGFLDLRDPSGTDGREEGAHGNAFDRVSAFQDGLTGGAGPCRAYEHDPPRVTESPFTSAQDRAVNGDPPLDESLPLVTRSLDAFWTSTAEQYDGAPRLVASTSRPVSCPGRSDGGVLSDTVIYCADTDSIVYAPQALRKASERIGDMAAGVLVAGAWASAVQHDVGDVIGTARSRAVSDCLTGGWAGAVQRGAASSRTKRAAVTFSPGDLDEVVAAFVATDKTPSQVERGSVFDRMRAFRRGFDGGPSACAGAAAHRGASRVW